jgi:hypothetical protein
MKTFVAASAVVALAGSSYGFIVNSLSLTPGSTLAPSSGSFVNSYSGFYLGAGKGIVTGDGNAWNDSRSYIENTTWLAIDRAGGADGFSGSASYGKGGTVTNVPEFNLGNGVELFTGTGGTEVGLLNDGSAFVGGTAGYAWSAPAAAGFEAPSAVSNVNGVPVDSIFIANLVLSDPAANLVGDDLFAKIDLEDGNGGQDIFLPLDGSEGTFGFSLLFERDRQFEGQLEVFIVVPTPGAAGVLGLAGLAAIRRRP